MRQYIAKLAELLIQDNALLFVGADLRLPGTNRPWLAEIAERLAAELDYQRPDRSLAEVAKTYKQVRGEVALQLALQKVVSELTPGFGLVDRLLADATLPTTKVITARFDKGVEYALEHQSKPYVTFVREPDIANYTATEVIVIKLQGDIAQPESLILTEAEVEKFFHKLPTLNDVIRAFFATKTWILLGDALQNSVVKRLFLQTDERLTPFRRTAYAFVERAVDEVEQRDLLAQGIVLQQCELVPLLEELATTIKELTPTLPRTPENPLARLVDPPLPAQPYKGLASYEQTDARIFAGRSDAAQRLTARILAHRVVLVVGESGCGKSSLLRAGVVPQLAKERAPLVICTPAPQQELAEQFYQGLLQVAQQVGVALVAPPSSAANDPAPMALVNAIKSWQERYRAPVVLGIDQFEQFFQVYGEEGQRATSSFLRDLVNNPTLDLRLVLVIRADFLSQLHPLEPLLPGLLSVRFHLERLGREAAQAVIEEPAAHFQTRWQPELVQTLLDALYDESRNGIATPQLQLVCERLYTGRMLPANTAEPALITLEQYRQWEGATGILRHHLDETVAAFAAEQQAIVRLLLTALVSSRGIKQRLALADIARTINLPPAQVAPLLDQLTERRLLQRYTLALPKEGSCALNMN